MSLINDALKRAKEVQKNNPPPPPDLQFRPADPSQPQQSGRPILLIVAVVAVLGLAALVVVLALPKRGVGRAGADAKEPGAPAPQTIAPSPVANPVVVVQPAPMTTPLKPGTAEPAGQTNTAAPAAPVDSATNAATAAIDPTPAKPASPKLQGIFYRPQRPSAVINGKNVFVGSRVGEFQVLAITQESVTIGSATQTNVLSLAE
jgi:hypothetical protein